MNRLIKLELGSESFSSGIRSVYSRHLVCRRRYRACRDPTWFSTSVDYHWEVDEHRDTYVIVITATRHKLTSLISSNCFRLIFLMCSIISQFSLTKWYRRAVPKLHAPHNEEQPCFLPSHIDLDRRLIQFLVLKIHYNDVREGRTKNNIIFLQ